MDRNSDITVVCNLQYLSVNYRLRHFRKMNSQEETADESTDENSEGTGEGNLHKLENIKCEITDILSDYACVTECLTTDEQHLKSLRHEIDSMKHTNDQLLQKYITVSMETKQRLQYMSYMRSPCRWQSSDVTSSSGTWSIKRGSRVWSVLKDFSLNDFYKLRLTHNEHIRLFEFLCGEKIVDYLEDSGE